MQRNPIDAEGEESLNLTETHRFIKKLCGGKAPCPRVLQRHCHTGRLDYFRIASCRRFLTTESWVRAYLEGNAPKVAGDQNFTDRDRRTRHAIARRQIRQAGTKGGRR